MYESSTSQKTEFVAPVPLEKKEPMEGVDVPEKGSRVGFEESGGGVQLQVCSQKSIKQKNVQRHFLILFDKLNLRAGQKETRPVKKRLSNFSETPK